MKRALISLVGLLLFAVQPVLAERVHYAPSVTGKKARKQIRYFNYGKNLVGDKKRIFDIYGYSPHRLRSNAAGKITERWKYLEVGKEFTFDREGNLLNERDIPRENRRAWVYQR
jgi:hypothetical protein